MPRSPGSIFLAQPVVVVHPQEGRTSVITSVSFPALVKLNSWVTMPPASSRPKSKTVSPNWIRVLELADSKPASWQRYFRRPSIPRPGADLATGQASSFDEQLFCFA
jgi:hypothetical protein